MEKINAIILTRNINFIKSINSVIKDFDNIIGCNILSNLKEVLSMKKTKKIDIAFWDPDVESISLKDQFELLSKDIRIIIISLNKKYAIEAFNIGAVDFLLKTICPDRLSKSIKKAIYLTKVSGSLTDFNERNFSKNPIKIITVSSLNDVNIIPVNSIIYLEAKGRYTLIHTKDKEIVMSSKNLGIYEDLLTRNNFFRIHHSFIVNVNNAIKIIKKDGSCLEINNNKYLPISKRRLEGFYNFLGITS